MFEQRTAFCLTSEFHREVNNDDFQHAELQNIGHGGLKPIYIVDVNGLVIFLAACERSK